MEQKKTINIGDLVRINEENHLGEKYVGKVGAVTGKTRVVYNAHTSAVWLSVTIPTGGFWSAAENVEVKEDWVELVSARVFPKKNPDASKPTPKRTIVIEITDDGANAKYVSGKEVIKTASIKRHPDDKPDDEMAAFLVTEKLFGRNLRGLESAIDEDFRLQGETLGWIRGAKEALDEAEKRIRKLI